MGNIVLQWSAFEFCLDANKMAQAYPFDSTNQHQKKDFINGYGTQSTKHSSALACPDETRSIE